MEIVVHQETYELFVCNMLLRQLKTIAKVESGQLTSANNSRNLLSNVKYTTDTDMESY